MGAAPLGVLMQQEKATQAPDTSPVRHTSDLIVYEMHVKGFTQHRSSGVGEDLRGTFAGVKEKIPHLLELGVTAVELMPVFQYDPQEGNYWGYMPLFFFVPHADYAMNSEACQIRQEFQDMVSAFHEVGIEVLLDVVYNHTGEMSQNGPAYNLKLIDNDTYYMSNADNTGYADFSGTGNSLRCASPAVRQLIVDSLRFWVQEMGVDGFRFDLASVFTRNSDGSINFDEPAIFSQIMGDPVLQQVRLIAEPWDAKGAYQLGRMFPGVTWFQWNGRFRDGVQRFFRGDEDMVGEMMTRVYGSADLFPDSLNPTFHPFQSINYVVSHDGSTLRDLVSYNKKYNEANGHNNTDGPNEFGWNCGHEGIENVPEDVAQLRRQQMRNFLGLLLVSNGTPMLRMGDEFGQTQGGNNNPYNQDNETSWLNWDLLDTHKDFFRFARLMIAFRKDHPSLARSRFWRDDVHWYGTGSQAHWSRESKHFAFCVHGANINDDDIYIMLNAHDETKTFTVQENGPWLRVVNTALPSPQDILAPVDYVELADPTIEVKAHSMVVLLKKQSSHN